MSKRQKTCSQWPLVPQNTCAITAVVDIIELDSAPHPPRSCSSHPHTPRDDGELLTNPLDKHARERRIVPMFNSVIPSRPDCFKPYRARFTRTEGYENPFVTAQVPGPYRPSGTGRCSSLSISAGGRRRRDWDSITSRCGGNGKIRRKVMERFGDKAGSSLHITEGQRYTPRPTAPGVIFTSLASIVPTFVCHTCINPVMPYADDTLWSP